MNLETRPFLLSKIALVVSINIGIMAPTIAQTDDMEVITVGGATSLNSSTNAKSLFGSRQLLDEDTIANANAMSLPELLKSQFLSVNINDVQNNPFQPDLQYRGFTASPLLGLPQGISIYLGGARVNEVFGDTVNWDLIPLDAIDSVALYSGSNPIFGQNTLGGALALSTKNGFSYESNELELGIGSDGRQEIGFEAGGNKDRFGYYINVSQYEEDGWRDYSPSEVKQVFTSLSYKGDKSSFDLNYMFADNELTGNGAAPAELLEIEGRSAVYTNPDQTNNELHQLSGDGQYELSDSMLLSYNFFYRKIETASINGDDSDYGACTFADERITLCELEDDDDDDDDDELPEVGDEVEAVEFVGFMPDTAFAEISDLDPSEVDGTYNTGLSETDNIGLSVQLAKQYSLSGKASELIIGAGYQRGDITYEADTTFGILANDTALDSRAVTPLFGIQDAEAQVRLDVDTKSMYIFVVNSTQLSDSLKLNIAGRFNDDHIIMEDLIDDGEGSLDGDHKFSQFNPAVSLDFMLSDNQSMNIGWSQASRTPSPAELSCADENDPCRLPNGFVADPPLDQVVTKTIELSYQGNFDALGVYANLFRSDSEDDIIFQQAGSIASRGYFINIDKTIRKGLELGVNHSLGDLHYQLSYSYLDATYGSSFTSFSPFNPQGANRQVNSGDDIPGHAKHVVKANVDYRLNDNLSTGLELVVASSQYYRGDEANENDKIDGYEVLNFFVRYDILENLNLQLRVNNLLDKEYNTFGVYGEADEVLEDIYENVEAPNFVGPAAPRQIALKLKYEF